MKSRTNGPRRTQGTMSTGGESALPEVWYSPERELEDLAATLLAVRKPTLEEVDLVRLFPAGGVLRAWTLCYLQSLVDPDSVVHIEILSSKRLMGVTDFHQFPVAG